MSLTLQQSSINKEMRIAVRHSIVYGLGSVLAKAIGFFMLPVYTHYLSPRDYGILEILDLTMTLIGMFLSMGITAAVLRYYNLQNSLCEKRTVIATAFLSVIGTGTVVWLLAAIFARPITTLLFNASVPATYFVISFSSFTLGYITNVPNAYMQAKESSGTLVITDTAMLFVILALNIYFIAVAQIGIVGVLLSPLLGGSLKASLFAWWTIRDVGLGFSMARFRDMAIFGAPLIFSNLALFTLNFSDRFFLQHYRSLQTVGIYAVGYKFGFLLNLLVIQPFWTMWQARIYRIEDKAEGKEIFSRMFIFYSLVLISGALALSLFGAEIIEVMVDRRFVSSKTVVPIVALAYAIYGSGAFCQAGLLLTLRTRTIGALGAVAAAANLCLNAVLVPRFGMLGAAWATVLGFLVIAAGTCFCSWKSFAAYLGVARVLKALCLAVGMYLVSLALGTSTSIQTLLLKGALLTTFFVLVGVTGLLSREELASLASARDSVLSFAGGILRPNQGRTGTV